MPGIHKRRKREKQSAFSCNVIPIACSWSKRNNLDRARLPTKRDENQYSLSRWFDGLQGLAWPPFLSMLPRAAPRLPCGKVVLESRMNTGSLADAFVIFYAA